MPATKRSVRRSLAEDAADISAFEKRRTERTLPFEQVVASMKHRKRIEGGRTPSSAHAAKPR
jgi:hypothetical protein